LITHFVQITQTLIGKQHNGNDIKHITNRSTTFIDFAGKKEECGQDNLDFLVVQMVLLGKVQKTM
jgi:hypothetical protein